MNRFLLFGYNDYYPQGGGYDFLAGFPEKQLAIDHGPKKGRPRYYHDRYHVFDVKLEKVVYRCMSDGTSEDGDD